MEIFNTTDYESDTKNLDTSYKHNYFKKIQKTLRFEKKHCSIGNDSKIWKKILRYWKILQYQNYCWSVLFNF